jgi:hypothetical protein
VWLLASMAEPAPLRPEYPTIGNPLAVPALAGPMGVAVPVSGVVVLAALVVGAASLVGRLRRARGTERLQLRWLALAAALLLIAVAALVMDDGFTLLNLALGVCVALLPLATGAAILRYRLYDLDYLISRTVVYGLLTAGGIGVYVGVVKLADWLLREGVGLGGSLLATAVIAVGFAPARDRLQRFVDRRLYGDRHDPMRAVARLGERLRDAPGGAPGGDVLAGVLQVVCETLRLPFASLCVEDGVEVASFGQPVPASEQVPLEHEGRQIGVLLVGVRPGEDDLGWSTGRSLGS